MSNYATGPNTFEQIRWSARAFRAIAGAGDAEGIAIREPAFRDGVRQGQPDLARLVKYVNQWGCRIPDGKADGIGAAVGAALPLLAPLAASALEFDDLRCATLDSVARAFDNLTGASGVGPTAASAILTALNPQLFVSWGAGIKNAYFPDDKANGATYAQFLTVMRMAALSIARDARAEHGIDDPAGMLSAELGINPPFSLAKFIDEYNLVTVARGMAYPAGAVAV